MTAQLEHGFTERFLTNTDDTGRFIVVSKRTGRKYFVEPIETAHTPKWGSIDPATGQLMNKKGSGKYRGGISADESMITAENGFEKIHLLEQGVSPLHAIDVIDGQYPDKTE
jgi:hypothetical protein